MALESTSTPSSPTRHRSSSTSFPSIARVDEYQSGPTDERHIALTRRTSAEMEGASYGHRRRRSSQPESSTIPPGSSGRNDMQSGSYYAARRTRGRDPDGIREEEGKRGDNEDEDDDRSTFSSASTSDDVEMDELQSDEGLEDDEETGLTKSDRKRRRRRKKRNARLDSRVAPEIKASEMENLADQSVLRRSLVNALLIASWYLFSLSISIYNKWMFSKDFLDFHFPLFTTSIHMLVQFSLASLVLYLLPRFRPQRHTEQEQASFRAAPSDEDGQTQKKPLMTKLFYATRIGPCGIATGLDIGFGNMSLQFISLTFFTMCKSSALGFVLIFAFLFRLEAPSIKLVLIIVTMTGGVVMMVAGETAFNVIGFNLVISSAFFSGFRWALTQILLLRNPATSNPFSSIFFLAPVMFVSLLIIALGVEQPGPLIAGFSSLVDAKGVPMSILIVLFPGLLAFLMTSSEFALLKRTSVVTLSICGIFKEVVTISAAGIVFHDPLTPINVSGLLITIASIAAYNYIKIDKMRRDARAETQGAAADLHGAADGGYAPVPGTGPAESGDQAGSEYQVSVNASGTSMGPRQLDLSIPSRMLHESPGPANGSPIPASPARVSPVKKDAREED